ncbi:retropepsin-like aspartic protease family protein [Arenicellales bacterium IMCC56312]
MNRINVTILSAIMAVFLSGCAPDGSQINQSSETITTSLYQQQPQKFFVDPDYVDFRGAVTIPIEVDELGNIHINAVINRTLQVRFTLDTGATFVSISNKTWTELKSKGGETITEFFSARPSSAQVATGEVIETTNFLLDLLEIGEGRIQFFKVLASRTDDAEGSNLLGMSFLKELGEFTIDVNNGVLIARPSDVHRLMPRGEYFAATDQRMMAAIQHWDVAAKQEALNISEKLKGNDNPIFIEVSPNSQFTDEQGAIPFQQVYPDLLSKHLLAMGRSISSSVDQQGELQPLTLKSKIMVGYHSKNWDELIITTEIFNQSEMLFSDSNIFYLYPEHKNNYGPMNKWEEEEVLPTFSVVNCNSESDC